MKRTIVLSAAALLAAPTALLVTAPAHADGPEKHARGSVAGARYDIDIEKERGFEVNVELDGVPSASTWRVVVKHDGERIGSQTAPATRDDGRYEVDFRDLRSKNTAGKDTFTVTIKRVGGPGSVTRTLTFAR